MKIGKMAIAAAVAMLLSGASASAGQNDVGLAPRSPFARQVAYNGEPGNREFDDRADEKSEGKPVGATEAAGGDECVSCWSEKYEPVRLFGRTRFEKKYGIEAIGWIAASYTQNFYSPRDRFNGPVTWTDRSNEAQLNELYSIIKRETKNDGEGWDFGFRWDTMYGTSARFCTSAGFEDKFSANYNQPFYNIAMPTACVYAAYNDLKATIGRFISPVGFYTVGTYNNFFNTIPYTYQYGEPFTHTGALFQYQITDDLNLGAGITRGWDNTGGTFNKNAGYLGTITRNNLRKEGDSLAYVQVWSNEPVLFGADPNQPISPTNQPAFVNRYFQTLVYSRPINEKMTYIIQSDFGTQNNAFGDGRAAHWYGVNQYLYYKYNNCWSWGINGEWFRDDLGFRVGGFLPNQYQSVYGPGTNPRGLSTARSGFQGNFYQVTFGPRWTPNPNLVIRPNMRWDFYDGGTNNAGLTPFGDGIRAQQGILGTDVIVVY